MSEVSTTSIAKKTAPAASKTGAAPGLKKEVADKKATAAIPAAYSFAEIKPLLMKYTCIACHNPDKRQVGPAYADVAKRNYSVAKILSLIKNPQPQNWPGYSTPMAPMPQVPKEDATKIATWINSLKTKAK